MKNILFKLALLFLLGIMISSFFYFNIGRYLTLTYMKDNLDQFRQLLEQNPLEIYLIFFGTYILVTALSIPGATILTLTAGAIFGIPKGFVLVSFASTIGATFAFLGSRFLFKDFIQKKFAEKTNVINEGVKKNGSVYLLSLRLLPIFPFFIINILMGLTPIKIWKFFIYSQVGMIPGTLVYINAGTQLSTIESPQDILSPQVFLSFMLLGFFPLIINRIKKILQVR